MRGDVTLRAVLTGTHVVSSANTEHVAPTRASGRQTKICEVEGSEVVAHKYVLRLQVAVVDAVLVAGIHCIDQLNEERPEELVVTSQFVLVDRA